MSGVLDDVDMESQEKCDIILSFIQELDLSTDSHDCNGTDGNNGVNGEEAWMQVIEEWTRMRQQQRADEDRARLEAQVRDAQGTPSSV